MSPIVPREWNIFESEREFDPEFFSGSPYHSKPFVLGTILLCIDLGVGASIGLAFWSLMPPTMKTFFVLLMIGLPIVWIRMRRDHRKMCAWYTTAPRAEIDTYPVRMASHLMTFAPYYLYLLVLFLLFCLAGALRHQAKLVP
jgi:hypothetical protein